VLRARKNGDPLPGNSLFRALPVGEYHTFTPMNINVMNARSKSKENRRYIRPSSFFSDILREREREQLGYFMDEKSVRKTVSLSIYNFSW